MPRHKLQRYQSNQKDNLIFQQGKDLFEKVKQSRHEIFHNTNPIVLELACGKGEYTVGLAPHFPNKNFIGIDLKGNRLRYGAQAALEKKLSNVAFLRMIIQNITPYFVPGTIDEIWVVHPDPRPKGADARRRLTHPRFLKMYEHLLRSGGLLKLKTDDSDLFSFSQEMLVQEGWEILESTTDLDNSPLLVEHYGIQTNYEVLFKAQGRTINYLKARKGG